MPFDKSPILHKASDRGHTQIDWLNSWHSFSFGHYFDPTRKGFGALRVINDDCIEGGQGFDLHPHENMEILTLVLDGAVKHKDSAGHQGLITPNMMQYMSAGSGIWHSEHNGLNDKSTVLLQIWIIPNLLHAKPRYKDYHYTPPQNAWLTLAQPDSATTQGLDTLPTELPVGIRQEASLSLGIFEAGQTFNLSASSPKHGGYLFVIDGQLEGAGVQLSNRDALGFFEPMTFTVKSAVRVLHFDVPMVGKHAPR